MQVKAKGKGGLSDSDKILLQLLLDVRLFGRELEALLIGSGTASVQADIAPYRALSEARVTCVSRVSRGWGVVSHRVS